MGTITKPSAGDAPWTTTGDALVDSMNAITDTFLDVSMVPSGGQTISYATMSLINLDTEAADTANAFNTSTHLYTIPATGRYLCTATVRIEDQAISANTNLGFGIHTSSADFAGFLWNIIPDIAAAPGSRWAAQYTRIADFTLNDDVRLFCYHDAGAPGGTTLDLYSASMQIWRIK